MSAYEVAAIIADEIGAQTNFRCDSLPSPHSTFLHRFWPAVDEGLNGATSVDPDQTVTITVPCEATDATTFEIQRVMVSA